MVLTRGLDLFHHKCIINVCALVPSYMRLVAFLWQESACVYLHNEVISVIMEMIHHCVKFKIC